MKKTLLIFLLFIASNAFSQINGSFSQVSDLYGNPFWCFQGTNTSRSNLNIRVYCINERLRQQHSFNLTVHAGYSFTVGPSQGWTWKAGDKCIVELPNGSKKTWEFKKQPTFTGHGACTYYNSIRREKCKCPGYKGQYEKGPCSNCGHKFVDHKR